MNLQYISHIYHNILDTFLQCFKGPSSLLARRVPTPNPQNKIHNNACFMKNTNKGGNLTTTREEHNMRIS